LNTNCGAAGTVSDSDVRIVNRAIESTVLDGNAWEVGVAMALTDNVQETSFRIFDKERLAGEVGQV